MARPTRTGVRGLFRDSDGRYRIDLRWHDLEAGIERRHQERLPVGASAVAAKGAGALLETALVGSETRPRAAAPLTLLGAFDQ